MHVAGLWNDSREGLLQDLSFSASSLLLELLDLLLRCIGQRSIEGAARDILGFTVFGKLNEHG